MKVLYEAPASWGTVEVVVRRKARSSNQTHNHWLDGFQLIAI